MLRTLLIVALSAASATQLVKPAPRNPALRLRGGHEGHGHGNIIVGGTAVLGAATGASMMLGTEKVTDMLWLGLNKFPHDPYIGLAMIGWAAGKWNAVKTDHAKEFAQLNCIPLLLWVLTNIQRSAAPTTTIIPAVLLAAYAFTGFVEA